MGYSEGAAQSVPTVVLADVAARSKGLVALTGCMGGIVPQAICQHGEEAGVRALGELSEMFERGSLFVELQDHGLPEQPVLNELLTRIREEARPAAGRERTTSSSSTRRTARLSSTSSAFVSIAGTRRRGSFITAASRCT